MGDQARKPGTLLEDLVYPSLPRVLREFMERKILDLGARRKRRLEDGRVREFDTVAVMADVIGLNSAKANRNSADVDCFIQDIGMFRELFPDYRGSPLVGMPATLAVDECVSNDADRDGCLALGVSDEVMAVKNRSGFEPKRWRKSGARVATKAPHDD